MPRLQYWNIPCNAPMSIPKPIPNATLLTVLLFIRHGMRSPSQVWHLPGNEGYWSCNGIKDATRFPYVTVNGQPYDYYNFNQSKQYVFPPSCEKSSLNDEGVKQLFELGQLYYKYSINSNLISPNNFLNTLSIFSVRSSFVTRCIESALSFLNGFFYKYDGTFNQTFDIKTGKLNEEPLAPSPFRSKMIYDNMIKFIDQDDYRERQKRSEEIIQKFKKYLNVNFPVHEFESLAFGDYINTLRCNRQDTAVIRNDDEKDEEELITPEIHRELMKNVFYLEGNFYNFSLAPTIAPIFKLILEKLENIEYEKPDHLFNLFSAHSETLSALITAFGYDSEFTPPFASHLLMEVWKQDDSETFLRILLNGEEIKRVSLYEFEEFASELISEYEQTIQKSVKNISIENKVVLKMKNRNQTDLNNRIKIVRVKRVRHSLPRSSIVN